MAATLLCLYGPALRAAPLLSIVDDGCGLPDGTLRGQQNNRSRLFGHHQERPFALPGLLPSHRLDPGATARPDGPGTEARLTLPQREGFTASPTLRSVTPEDTLYTARQLWMALATELGCVPGMEGTRFQIPAELA